MNQPELGKTILELRQNKRWTQAELAEKCNLSLRTIQRIELSEVTPRSHTINAIFSCLDYDVPISPANHNEPASAKESSKKKRFGRSFKKVLELFNLKTNTMKKVSVISLILVLITTGLVLTNNNINAQKIEGWYLAGSKPKSYTIGLDKSTYKTGGSSAFLESTDKKIDGFGTLMQSCGADDYLGKRVKMSAYVKSEDVTEWAGMWMRVDSRLNKKALSFDNMKDRPIKGTTEWTKYEIILDVPEDSGVLCYGILIGGTGKIWFDNISFEVVDKINTKPTKEYVRKRKPSNLNFEE
ncbi:MAG: helix-turn-helix domain-containing protein [Bacteroidales bacterium]|nr:helix-turn-helix domain-containing protein [Bacteroidales bacterium]